MVLSFLQVLFLPRLMADPGLYTLAAPGLCWRPLPHHCAASAQTQLQKVANIAQSCCQSAWSLVPQQPPVAPGKITTVIHLLPIYTISTKVTLYLQLLKNVQFLTWVTCAKLNSTNRPMCTQKTLDQWTTQGQVPSHTAA